MTSTEPADLLQLARRGARAIVRGVGRALRWAWAIVLDQVLSNLYVVALLVWGFFRAMGVTVQTGQHALRFTVGRAGKLLEPGFHFLVPFVQTAKLVPTRHRTMDLEDQRVVTRDGLVVLASATLVWRVEDVVKSLIEVDHLVRAMRQWLAVAVGRVLSRSTRDELGLKHEGDAAGVLDARLEAELSGLLAPWGVRVERAGFPTIAPSPRTALLLQTRERVTTRRAVHLALGADAAALFAAGGRAQPPVRRMVRAVRREAAARAARRAVLGIRRAALDRDEDPAEALSRARAESRRRANDDRQAERG